MTARVVLPGIWLVVLAACGHRPPRSSAPPSAEEDRVAILASEITATSARLVAIDERGDRRFVAIAEPSATAFDTNPAVSPDGRWVVFESTRGFTEAQPGKSLWIARVGVEQIPVRLTTGAWYDTHACWTRDGSAIVFASTRAGGDFDLWRLPVTDGRAAGDAVQLTDDPRQEVTPTLARDGTIYYSLADRNPRTSAIESYIMKRTPAGAATQLSPGTSPALSPDETTLAFTLPTVAAGRPNSELWLLRLSEDDASELIELPPSDEGGPVWSRDGRFLFATSALRADQGAVFSSVIHIDMTERPPRARMLEDRAGGIKRLTPAIVAAKLDAAALRSNPEYLPELARIMTEAIERAKGQEP